MKNPSKFDNSRLQDTEIKSLIAFKSIFCDRTQKAYTFQYRVRNWRTYNQALIARGGITFWIDEAALVAWKHSQTNRRRGAPRIYSDTAIQCALVVKGVYGLSLRAAQGFVSSVMRLMRLDLPVPNYSTVCRRQGSLTVPIFSSPNSKPRHVVIDATGLRVYGAGEWHVQKHRGGHRRVWRKLHLGVDEHTKEIVAVEVTTSRVHDSRMLPSLLTQIPGKICQVSGDGAYDTKACYESIGQRGAKATIPPRRNAKQLRCDNAQGYCQLNPLLAGWRDENSNTQLPTPSFSF